MIFKIEEAKKDNRAVLGWFPRSKCWFSMVWDCDMKRWESFGGDGYFHGEQPTYFMEMPPLLK